MKYSQKYYEYILINKTYFGPFLSNGKWCFVPGLLTGTGVHFKWFKGTSRI